MIDQAMVAAKRPILGEIENKNNQSLPNIATYNATAPRSKSSLSVPFKE